MPAEPPAEPAPLTLPRGVLLDMDGTLVDTEPLWWRAAEEAATRTGRPLEPRDAADVVGQPVARTAAFLHARGDGVLAPAELGALLEDRFLALVGTELTVLPGATGLLALLRASGIATALVSASPRPVMDVVLRALGAHGFTTTVAAGESRRTKPHPDPYLAALAALELTAAVCLAVEDSPTGLAAAEAAGLAVVLVPSRVHRDPAPGRTFVGALAEIDLALLDRALSGRA